MVRILQGLSCKGILRLTALALMCQSSVLAFPRPASAESIVPRLVGLWNNDNTGDDIEVKEDNTVLLSDRGQGRIAETIEYGANVVIKGRDFSCYYSVRFTNGSQRSNWQLRAGTGCPKGIFNRTNSSQLPDTQTNRQSATILPGSPSTPEQNQEDKQTAWILLQRLRVVLPGSSAANVIALMRSINVAPTIHGNSTLYTAPLNDVMFSKVVYELRGSVVASVTLVTNGEVRRGPLDVCRTDSCWVNYVDPFLSQCDGLFGSLKGELVQSLQSVPVSLRRLPNQALTALGIDPENVRGAYDYSNGRALAMMIVTPIERDIANRWSSCVPLVLFPAM